MAETSSPHTDPPSGDPPQTVVVVSGGSAPHPAVREALPADAYVISADSGYAHARSLGLHVDVLIGDFDSIQRTDLAIAEQSGTRIVGHPVDKDATDLELALELAAESTPDEIVVVAGGEGDRIDHFITTVSLLCDPRFSGARMSGWFGRARLIVVRPGQPAFLQQVRSDAPGTDSANGMFVTLDPITDEAIGVTTTGLKFALNNATLHRHRTRGVSNVFVGPSASVHITDGALLVVQPTALRLATTTPLTQPAQPT